MVCVDRLDYKTMLVDTNPMIMILLDSVRVFISPALRFLLDIFTLTILLFWLSSFVYQFPITKVEKLEM